MLSTAARVGLLFGLAGCLTLAAQAQPAAGTGTIKKVDAKAGTITVEVPVRGKKKKDEAEKEYLLAEDAAVTVTVDGVKKEMKGKEALQTKALKVGDSVSFKAQGDLKIVELRVLGSKKKAE